MERNPTVMDGQTVDLVADVVSVVMLGSPGRPAYGVDISLVALAGDRRIAQ
jgi:hypothetical protein